MVFWETPYSLALVSLRRVLGWAFLVLVLLCSPGIWELRPNTLKADPAAGTFGVYFILDCQASVPFLNTCRHYFIQPLLCKPFFWETGQCANSTVCLPQCVRDFFAVFVRFSLWICQTWRAASAQLPSSRGKQWGLQGSIKLTSSVCPSQCGKNSCSYLHALAFCRKH